MGEINELENDAIRAPVQHVVISPAAVAIQPFYDDGQVALYCGDCREILPALGDASFDFLLTDPPYGTTKLRWDTAINFTPLWFEFKRICKRQATMVIFANQPYATDIINSNRRHFRYELVWHKTMPTGFLDVAKRPLRAHENILIFCQIYHGAKEKVVTYNPQKTKGTPYYKRSDKLVTDRAHYDRVDKADTINRGDRQPISVLQFSNGNHATIHPTQKPQALIEWLIKTYTNAGDSILDPFAGSGTTLVAAKNLGRRAIGIEISEKYCHAIVERLAQQPLPLHEAI